MTTEPPPALTHEVTLRPDTSTTERTPAFSPDELDLPSDTMPSLPPMRSSEPIVRFRAPTPPPTEVAPGSSFAPTPTPTAERAFAPTPTPTPGSSTRPGGEHARLITPATALFAEPEPGAEEASPVANAPAQAVPPPSSSLTAPPEPTLPRRTSLRRVLVLALALVLLGAASALVALYLARVPETTTEVEPPVAPPPSKTVSTVKFVVVPADSTITIEGKPMHTGSPWDVDLVPGTHQIEIHHDGYKSWLTSTDLPRGETLTLRVVLDPLDSAAVADATLPPAAAPADHPGVAPVPASPPSPSPPANPTTPASVSPTAVVKISGRSPRIAKLGGAEVPSTISAKLCIDETGQITASTVLTELPPRAAAEIADALHSWRYAPYKVQGVARAACFVESVRVP